MLIKNVSLDLITRQSSLKITLASYGAAIWGQKDGARPKPVTASELF